MDMLNDDAIRAIGQYTGILYGPKSYTNFALTCKRTRNLLLPQVDSDNKVNDQTNIIIDNIIKARMSESSDNIVDNVIHRTIAFNGMEALSYDIHIRTLNQLHKYERCLYYAEHEANILRKHRLNREIRKEHELQIMRVRLEHEAEALQQRRLDREMRRERELEKMRIRSKKQQEKLMLEEARYRSIREY